MSYRDCVGLTRIQQEQADAQEAARMYPLNPSDGPAPYYLPGQCPLDAIEDVARGANKANTILFLTRRHIIQVAQWEWSLDSNLPLWREASMYAERLRESGLLTRIREDGRTEYRRA